MTSEQDLYNELAYYTLAHPDPAFVHQHIVDAFAAQHADESTKPITVVFGLLGLYLHIEKNFTGKQVQMAHMKLAKYRRLWVRPALPKDRGVLGVGDVLAAAPGTARDAMIHEWSASVWGAFRDAREQIVELARNELGVD